MEPNVSVIIPVYNSEKYIKSAIESVLKQTLEDFEIVIVDDASTDNTVDVITSIEDSRIRLFKNLKNKGPAYSRNKAIKEARGKWIAFLDSDDWWEEKRLDVLVRLAENHKVDMICDDLYLIYDGDKKPWTTELTNKKLKLTSDTYLSPQMVVENGAGMQPLIKKDFLLNNSLEFDENLYYGEDYKLYLECLVNGAELLLHPKPMYYYRTRKGSLVKDKLKLLNQTRETTRELLKTPKFDRNIELINALKKRQRGIEESLSYYGAIQPIKNGQYSKGIKEILKKPYIILIILKRIPKILNHQYLKYKN